MAATEPIEIVLDTDLAMGTSGGDPEDGFALLFALNSPEIVLRAVTEVLGKSSLVERSVLARPDEKVALMTSGSPDPSPNTRLSGTRSR